MSSPQEQREQLDYAARLSGILLNEATDVMRWFLINHLPRMNGHLPDLSKTLSSNRKMFELLRDDGKQDRFGFEYFDILFPPNEAEVDPRNLELSLLFILVRYLCKIKPPNWKWWNEDPQKHQKSPVFDVIRLIRFKNQMKRIVHNYEIRKDSYEASLDYITAVIDRLKGYKFSTRRWKDVAITYPDEEVMTKERKSLEYISVMRWHTLPIEERDATYLIMLENFRKQLKIEQSEEDRAWSRFLSCFGQMAFLKISDINEEKQTTEQKSEITTRSYLKDHESTSIFLNWGLVYDHTWRRRVIGNEFGRS